MERFFSTHLKASKLLSLIEIGRPWNGIVTGLLGVLGAVLIVGGTLSIDQTILIFLTFLTAYLGGAIVNDIFDTDVDRVNMPYRPIMQGRVTLKEASIVSAILHILSLTIAYITDIKLFGFTVLFLLLSLGYSMPPIYFVRRGALAQISLALITSVIPIYAGASIAAGTIELPTSVILQILTFSALFAFIFLLKDFKDLEGDSKGNKRTVALIMGPELTKKITVVGTAIFFLASIIMFNQKINSTIFLGASIAVLAGTILTENEIIKHPEKMFGQARLLLLAYITLIFLGLQHII